MNKPGGNFSLTPLPSNVDLCSIHILLELSSARKGKTVFQIFLKELTLYCEKKVELGEFRVVLGLMRGEATRLRRKRRQEKDPSALWWTGGGLFLHDLLSLESFLGHSIFMAGECHGFLLFALGKFLT